MKTIALVLSLAVLGGGVMWNQQRAEAARVAEVRGRDELRVLCVALSQGPRRTAEEDRALTAQALDTQALALRGWIERHAQHPALAAACELESDARRVAGVLRSTRDTAFCNLCLDGLATKAAALP